MLTLHCLSFFQHLHKIEDLKVFQGINTSPVNGISSSWLLQESPVITHLSILRLQTLYRWDLLVIGSTFVNDHLLTALVDLAVFRLNGIQFYASGHVDLFYITWL